MEFSWFNFILTLSMFALLMDLGDGIEYLYDAESIEAEFGRFVYDEIDIPR